MEVQAQGTLGTLNRYADILSLNHCAPRHTGRARARPPRRARSMHTERPPRARAIFSARHPGIPMNSYRISVLILNLPDFSELAPPYACIRGTYSYDHMCTPTRESPCGGPTQNTQQRRDIHSSNGQRRLTCATGTVAVYKRLPGRNPTSS